MSKKQPKGLGTIRRLQGALAMLVTARERGFDLNEDLLTRHAFKEAADNATMLLALLHFPPGTAWYQVQGAARDKYAANLPEAPWSSDEPHRDRSICELVHQDLPDRFSVEWLEGREQFRGLARECAGARKALQLRVQDAKRTATALNRRWRNSARVDEYGDLHVLNDADPFADLVGRSLADEPELQIESVEIFGRTPSDSRFRELHITTERYHSKPSELEWHADVSSDVDGPDDFEYRVYERYGLFGLFACRQRPLEIGKETLLHLVPVSHRYRDDRGEERKRKDTVRESRSKEAVIYLGPPTRTNSKRAALPPRLPELAPASRAPDAQLPGQLELFT